MSKDQETKTIVDLETRVSELEQLLEAEKQSKLLARADLENYRRNMESEKAKFGLITNRTLVAALLEILDDVQLAQQDESADVDRLKEVISILKSKLMASLHVAGVEQVQINVGDKFDPNSMEAITSIPVAEESKAGTVIDVISGAFKYSNQDQLLKAAKVVVGRAA